MIKHIRELRYPKLKDIHVIEASYCKYNPKSLRKIHSYNVIIITEHSLGLCLTTPTVCSCLDLEPAF